MRRGESGSGALGNTNLIKSVALLGKEYLAAVMEKKKSRPKRKLRSFEITRQVEKDLAFLMETGDYRSVQHAFEASVSSQSIRIRAMVDAS